MLCTQSREPGPIDQQMISRSQIINCAYCISKFKSKRNLKLHVQGVHLVDPRKKLLCFKCNFCESYFKLKKNLGKHITSNHKEKCLVLGPHKCGCGESFPSLLTYVKHQRISHCNPKKRSAHDTLLVNQNLTKSNATAPQSNKKIHECGECDKSYSKASNLKRHLEKHADTSYKCGECNRTYKSSSALNRHLETHKKAASHECSICDKAFHQKITLQNHLKMVHLGIRSFVCSCCGAKFTQKAYLIKHLKSIHPTDPKIQEKLHKCQYCDSYYSNKIHLSKHVIRLHGVPDIQTVKIEVINGKRLFRCEICDCLCSKFSNFTRHMTRHSVTKPFTCSLCDLRFKLMSALREHLKSVHDIKCKINDNHVLWKEIKNLSSDIFSVMSKEKNRSYIEKNMKTNHKNNTSKEKKVFEQDLHGLKIDENIFGLSMPLLDDESASNNRQLFAKEPERIQIVDNKSVLSVQNPFTKTVDSNHLNESNQINKSSSTALIDIHQYAAHATCFSKDAVLGQARESLVELVKLSCDGFRMPKQDSINEVPEVAPSSDHFNDHINNIDAPTELNDISLFNLLGAGTDSDCNVMLEPNLNAKENAVNDYMDTSMDLHNIDKSNGCAIAKITDKTNSSFEYLKPNENYSCKGEIQEVCKGSLETKQIDTNSLPLTNRRNSRDLDCSVSSLDISFEINAVSFQSSFDNISLSDVFPNVQKCNLDNIECQNSNIIQTETAKSLSANPIHCSEYLIYQSIVCEEIAKNEKHSTIHSLIEDHHDKIEKRKENISVLDIHPVKTINSELDNFVDSQYSLNSLPCANTTLTTSNGDDLAQLMNINNVNFLEETRINEIVSLESSANAHLKNFDVSSITTDENISNAYSTTLLDLNMSLSEINTDSTETLNPVSNSLKSLENPANDILDMLLCINDEINASTGQTITLPNSNNAEQSGNGINGEFSCSDITIENLDFQFNETQGQNILFKPCDKSQVCSNYESNVIWEFSRPVNVPESTATVDSNSTNVFLKDLSISASDDVINMSPAKSIISQTATTNALAINSINDINQNKNCSDISISTYTETTMDDVVTNSVPNYRCMNGISLESTQNCSQKPLDQSDEPRNFKELDAVTLNEAIYTENIAEMNSLQLQLSVNPNLIHNLDYKDDGNVSRKPTIGCAVGIQADKLKNSNVQKIVFEDHEKMLLAVLEQKPKNIDHPHKCKTCLASFKKPSDLLQHEMIHSSRDKLLCDLCGCRFSSKSALFLHIKYHNDATNMLCWICGKLLKKINFKRHPCLVARTNPCPFCKETFKSRSARLKHLLFSHMEHNTPKNGGKKSKQNYKCKRCQIDLTSLGKLHSHLSAVHNEKGQYVCKCGKAHWKRYLLLRHQKIHRKSPFQDIKN